jgi:hypothetical protein
MERRMILRNGVVVTSRQPDRASPGAISRNPGEMERAATASFVRQWSAA